MSSPHKYEAVKVADGTYHVTIIHETEILCNLPDAMTTLAVVNALEAEYNRGLKDGAEEAYQDGLDDGRIEMSWDDQVESTERDEPTKPSTVDWVQDV